MAREVGLSEGAVVDDRYEILRELGRSEHSCVFEALDVERDARVALKLLRPPASSHHLVRDRLQTALPRLSQLDHPRVVRMHRVFEWEGWIAIESERVEGDDLEARVSSEGGLDPERATAIARDVAEALAAAHEQGILHRDVKPRNVLLDAEQRARLVDFGCMRLEGQALLGEVDEPVATVAFLAPEVVAGRNADPRTDIYSLGMTLYFALVGRVPPCPTPRLPPPPRAAGYRPRERRPDVPVWLDEIVARATSAEPHERFETAARLIDALDARATQARVGADPQLLHVCVLCREPGAMGRPVCPHCEDEPDEVADTLVLLAAPSTRAERDQRRRVLAGLVDDAADAPRVGRAAAGDLPVLRVSRRQARRVAQRLAAHGLPARLVPVGESWAAIPRWALRGSVALASAGLLAGVFGQPLALGGLLALAAALIPFSALQVRDSALLPPGRGPGPSRTLVARVAEVIPQVDTGEARQLLVEALRLGRGLQRRLHGMSGGADALEAVEATLIGACAATRELAGIDPVLQALELHGEHRYEPPAGLVESRSMYEAARACVVQSLLEATAALSELRAAEMLDPERARGVLQERAAELSEDAAIAAQMSKEALGIFSAAAGR